MKDNLEKHNLKVILIQIDEAHSSGWPVGLSNQPEPQQTFEDRVSRANYFVNKYGSAYPVYIDNWTNEFAELFRAWPDKYHYVDRELNLIEKSEYGKYDHNEALIIKDYTMLLKEIINTK
jgi:hypothetical protein